MKAGTFSLTWSTALYRLHILLLQVFRFIYSVTPSSLLTLTNAFRSR